MNITKQRNVPQANIDLGEFNNNMHTFCQLEAGENHTISVRLPNGKFVTFAFIPGKGDEFECVDIHSTVGRRFRHDPKRDEQNDVHYVQQAIGFTRGPDTFDTRKINRPTGLITLLLGDSHHPSNSPVANL